MPHQSRAMLLMIPIWGSALLTGATLGAIGLYAVWSLLADNNEPKIPPCPHDHPHANIIRQNTPTEMFNQHHLILESANPHDNTPPLKCLVLSPKI